MKISIIIITVIFLSSCTKEENFQNMPVYFSGDISSGFISMKKNNRDMQARVSAVPCSKDETQISLFFTTVDTDGVLAEFLSLHCLSLRFDVQKLCNKQDLNCTSHMYYETVIDDQMEDRYILNSSKNNNIQITEIDSTTGWIKGKLEMHFDRDKSRPKVNVNNPEKVSFTEGNFSVKLPN